MTGKDKPRMVFQAPVNPAVVNGKHRKNDECFVACLTGLGMTNVALSDIWIHFDNFVDAMAFRQTDKHCVVGALSMTSQREWEDCQLAFGREMPLLCHFPTTEEWNTAQPK